MVQHVLLVGGGNVGTYLASLLLAKGHRVKVLEVRRDEGTTLPPSVMLWGNGTDPNVLETAGIRQTDVVAAVTGSDEVNLVVTSLARFAFRVPRTIARVNRPENAWLFAEVMGVDVALNQADLIAHVIIEEMSLGEMMTLLKLRKGQYSLVEEKVHPTAVAVGKAVQELPLPIECILSAIIRHGHLLIPHGNTVLQADDEILAVVHASQAAQLAALLGERSEPV
jgi:trk system potassium uptake protein TrkA